MDLNSCLRGEVPRLDVAQTRYSFTPPSGDSFSDQEAVYLPGGSFRDQEAVYLLGGSFRDQDYSMFYLP